MNFTVTLVQMVHEDPSLNKILNWPCKNLCSFNSMVYGYKQNTDHCALVDQVEVQHFQNFFSVCCICSVELKSSA